MSDVHVRTEYFDHCNNKTKRDCAKNNTILPLTMSSQPIVHTIALSKKRGRKGESDCVCLSLCHVHKRHMTLGSRYTQKNTLTHTFEFHYDILDLLLVQNFVYIENLCRSLLAFSSVVS